MKRLLHGWLEAAAFFLFVEKKVLETLVVMKLPNSSLVGSVEMEML